MASAAEEHAALPTKLAATTIGREVVESRVSATEPTLCLVEAAADEAHSPPAPSETLPEQQALHAYVPPPMEDTLRKQSASALFTVDVDINHSENRQTLSKSATHVVIMEATGVEIATRGRHYANSAEATSADPALHLHVEAPSQDMLTKAIDMIEAMKTEEQHARSMVPRNGSDAADIGDNAYPEQLSGRQSSAGGGAQRLQDKVYIEVETVRGFNVRAKVIGTGGENMKYIQNTTGARVQVRGNGSGCSDGEPGSDPYEPMHLFITASSEHALNQAKDYCKSLVETIHAQYHEFKDSGGRRYESSHARRDSRDHHDRHSSRHRSSDRYSGRSQQPFQPQPQPPGYSQPHQQEYPQHYHQAVPATAAEAAAYEEYANYYAQYYQYYGTYPDPSAYYSQADPSAAQPRYPVSEQCAQGADQQSHPPQPSASTANFAAGCNNSPPYNAQSYQNGYHSVPPPTDYSSNRNNKV
ncbi:aconitate hydratase [Coemansia thaxteri]|uniref:Aconitate hydratase n=1 Tax=Coemansia thaxteri TaxID=2663907 RepID=A0A9W8BBA6_9FUNG|nr:aconitate hydratase [Coemansia thaxteri]